MGVREPARADAAPPAPASGLQRYTVELPALLRLVGRSARNFFHIRRIVADFQAHFRAHYERWSAMDFRAMPPHELAALYREMEEKLLWEWKAPIINDFFVMIFYGTLKKLCVSWCGDESGSLQNDLICGEGGIESTEPTKMLLALAAQARRNPELRQLLLEGIAGRSRPRGARRFAVHGVRRRHPPLPRPLRLPLRQRAEAGGALAQGPPGLPLPDPPQLSGRRGSGRDGRGGDGAAGRGASAARPRRRLSRRSGAGPGGGSSAGCCKTPGWG